MFELAHFVGVTRPGFELSDAHLPADAVSLVQVPAMAISSTDCRARVAAGKPVWYLVPDGVVQYIAKRGLYRWSLIVTLGGGRAARGAATREACEGRPMTFVEQSGERTETRCRHPSARWSWRSPARAGRGRQEGEDIVIIDVADQLVITDAFVLASAPNERQVFAIVDAIEERLAQPAGEGQAGAA